MNPPDAVYADPDGLHYVALFEDELLGVGLWWRWPAVAHGWRARHGCSEAAADACSELPARLARLALKLSGAPHDEL